MVRGYGPYVRANWTWFLGHEDLFESLVRKKLLVRVIKDEGPAGVALHVTLKQ